MSLQTSFKAKREVDLECNEGRNSTALLGKFAGFLEGTSFAFTDDIPGIICALSTAIDLSKNGEFWIVDSGASEHITNDFKDLSHFEKSKIPSHVSIANGSNVPISGKGKIKIFSDSIESPALFVPSFPFKLLSVGKLTRILHCLAIFSDDNIIFQDRVTKMKIGEGFFLNGLYFISTNSSLSKCFLLNSNASQQKLWHKRLAHPSFPVLSRLFPNFCKVAHECEICHLSKQTRLPFKLSHSRTTKPFELVHSDVWGPASIDSFDGYRFYVTFIDDFSRSTFVYLLKLKSEVFKCFQDFHNLIINQFSSKLETLRSDNGTEFTSKIMRQYLSDHDIIHQTSCVGTPQQNGIAERKNRDLLEKARALMLQSHVPKRFWSQGIQSAAYLINRLPSSVLDYKSPFELLKGRKIDISHLRTFGCTCFVHVQADKRDKLDPRSIKCMFLGYSSTQKGYKCYNPLTRKIFVSRDVVFHEDKSFYQCTTGDLQGECLTEVFPMTVVLPTPTSTTSTPTHDEVIHSGHNEQPCAETSDQEVEHETVQQVPSLPRRNPP